MFKRILSKVLLLIGLGVVLMVIWQVWGRDGRITEFFIMIWDAFFAIITAGANMVINAFSDIR